ncbi:hypothetical protein LEP1GSC195_0931 [Leptospira wolbachii serovar Codice str. CDC]|uniref:SIR2-like domain protein n=1 Tax=Leptospira wolbachii serovar Codice str. CDC TaxID=1218599 RepID=R9A3L3_9LEPT|nr:hypothetical protein [Leptospira wolbachii]EOQ94820.1 hypothetical protein LEP1GSC195_0931 [Leptospira wolbachii serovar Codice str. CDC]
MEHTKITYILGAGASFNCIPIVKNFSENMDNIANLINNYIKRIEGLVDYPKLEINPETNKNYILFDYLKQLKNTLESHASVDTYARILSIRAESNDLRNLKFALSIYLTILQLLRKTDNRYEVFLSSVLDEKKGDISLPNNVNFISWNYDMQLEKSISEILNYGHHNSHLEILNVFHSPEENLDDKKPYLIKLNGTASFFYHWGNRYDLLEYNFAKSDRNGILELLKYSESIFNNPRVHVPFAFAWESDNKLVLKNRELATEILKETEILVIIGYSFPVFNRKIDRNLLKDSLRLSLRVSAKSRS